jgi:hypothetical protein
MLWLFESKKIVEAYPYLRRLCDLTTPNVSCSDEYGRSENRYNRTIPVLLCPWTNDAPLIDQAAIVLTKDIADGGLGLVVPHAHWSGNVALGFWLNEAVMSEPWFFLGAVQRSASFGGGYWCLGVELKEFANPEHGEALAPLHELARSLLPHAEACADR